MEEGKSIKLESPLFTLVNYQKGTQSKEEANNEKVEEVSDRARKEVYLSSKQLRGGRIVGYRRNSKGEGCTGHFSFVSKEGLEY